MESVAKELPWLWKKTVFYYRRNFFVEINTNNISVCGRRAVAKTQKVDKFSQSWRDIGTSFCLIMSASTFFCVLVTFVTTCDRLFIHITNSNTMLDSLFSTILNYSINTRVTSKVWAKMRSCLFFATNSLLLFNLVPS